MTLPSVACCSLSLSSVCALRSARGSGTAALLSIGSAKAARPRVIAVRAERLPLLCRRAWEPTVHRWAAKRARIQLTTPHGRRPGWDLRCVIVKSGDDCRQELLAMQVCCLVLRCAVHAVCALCMLCFGMLWAGCV